MSQATIIFPHQLFQSHPALDKKRPIYLIEDPHFFTRFSFHKHKLILHKASVSYYATMLKKQKYTIHYITLEKYTSPTAFIKKHAYTELHMGELYDHELEHAWTHAAHKHNVEIILYETPYFMTPRDELEAYFSKQKPSFRLHHFYQQQRKRFDILLTSTGKPRGGAWSFDKENRQPLPETVVVPPISTARTNAYVRNAQRWINKTFKNNPGDVDSFWYPTTHASARTWLNNFFDKRFAKFGPYQDAIDKNESTLFHSVLSPLLNIGLLTPEHVVDSALSYAQDHTIPLNSLEGFIRQIIGWREFMGGIYVCHGTQESQQNFFKHKRKLPQSFWNGTTDITPIDNVINRVIETSYVHHIERLMVLGNFMLLCKINPHDVYQWFMELFIDSYDWVMIPNVYGMSQFADGGWFATKPYISSSNYIRKMSNFKKSEWCDIWDGLYWNFIYTNKKFFSQQPRFAMMYNVLKRMDKTTLNKHLTHARKFLRSLST